MQTVLLLAGTGLAAVVALLGGMQYFIMVLALASAVWVARNPREAVSTAWLFLLASMILLPSEARLRFIDNRYYQVWQMYYWAAGSLLIALAAAFTAGIANLWRVPWSLKVFTLVALASSVFGVYVGNAPSYVVRQLYGSILFVLYFGIALVTGDEELLYQRLKRFGPLLAVVLLIYYASVFSQFGFHKEDTSVTSQFGFVAAFLFAKGVIERRSSWLLPALSVLGASLLFFMRHVFLTFLFALALALAVRSASRIFRFCYFTIAAVVLLPSIFPFGAQFVLDTIEKQAPALYDLLPAGTGDTTSLMSRNMELVVAGATVVKSPVFGAGMGSELAWDDPARGEVEQAFVDNGWAYVIAKMGCAGILAFGWVLFTILRCFSKQSLAISVSLLAILTIAMFSEPVCFQFTVSPIAGSLAGLLYARKYGRRGLRYGAASRVEMRRDPFPA